MKGKVMPWKGVIFFAAFFFVLFIVGMIGVLSSRSTMEAQYEQQQTTVVLLERDVAALRNELERVGTDGYVENEARSRYGYVRNGEIRFEFSDPDKLGNYTEEEWNIVVEAGLYSAN